MMKDITAYGLKFFLFGGAMLIAIAVLQILTRQRSKEKKASGRIADATMIRPILFFSVGVLAILIGTGIIPMNSGR